MIECSARDFEKSPIGKYTCTGSCVVWVATPNLVGWRIWGRPDETETRSILRVMDAYIKVGVPFDIVADSRGVEVINPIALPLLASWVIQNRAELKARVRLQANVIRRDPIGFLLMGVIASVSDMHRFETYTDPVEAFRTVAGEAGVAICEEVEQIVQRVHQTPHELQQLRVLLSTRLDLAIRPAAKELSMSPRSLQRVLSRYGTSFHDEQSNARFDAAKTLLIGSDAKISNVASRVGWSERTLTVVFRAKTGLTPADWRKKENTKSASK
jgi:AraC-like DNA-binding protein